MNTNKIYGLMALLLIAAVALFAPLSAEAAGTASGTQIGNNATISYDVTGVPQTPISTGPTATFAVDNKVNLTVTKNSDLTTVPGSTNQTLVFTVTNNGNTTQRYALSPTNSAGIVMNNVRIYLDNGTTPNVWDASDTLYVDASTFGNVAADGSLKILIVADTPAGATNAQTSNYNLIATTVDANTLIPTVQTAAGAETLAGVDVVFADAAGSAAGDVARDGKHSAVGTYTVTAATLTILKSAATYSDPFNGTTNPKAIPGAVMTYTITVSNTSGATATNVTVSDNLTGMPVTFDPQFNDGVTTTCGATQGIVVGGVCKSNAVDGDNADYGTPASTVLVSGLTVTAGTSVDIKFQVTIN